MLAPMPFATAVNTARKLCDSFDKATVLAALEHNALRSGHTLTSNDDIPFDSTLSSNEGASRSWLVEMADMLLDYSTIEYSKNLLKRRTLKNRYKIPCSAYG